MTSNLFCSSPLCPKAAWDAGPLGFSFGKRAEAHSARSARRSTTFLLGLPRRWGEVKGQGLLGGILKSFPLSIRVIRAILSRRPGAVMRGGGLRGRGKWGRSGLSRGGSLPGVSLGFPSGSAVMSMDVHGVNLLGGDGRQPARGSRPVPATAESASPLSGARFPENDTWSEFIRH